MNCLFTVISCISYHQNDITYKKDIVTTKRFWASACSVFRSGKPRKATVTFERNKTKNKPLNHLIIMSSHLFGQIHIQMYT